MERRSPAQAFALVFGAALVVLGVAGFFYNADFGSGDGTDRDAVLGILDVNGWHNVLHVLTGAIGLAVSGAYDGSRVYALVFGAIYLVIAVLGFAAGNGDELFDLIPVNTEDNVLHLLIGFAGVGAGIATPATPAPSTG
jgi:RsiW-degrading membrane proteinase PrsW (M82 family)